ncbi:hypothetical protein LR48_Vigan07g285600 [Vigna angularis]|uniref:Proteasome alpha-type subunits domain-containing protein n=1 Tax=Phaseolus angularis TaxID=3914 RepID=A0A0L9V2P9_PHAAN|nr:hypothetical protein LR48_Vigan07g285600 [Vigna angularis]
MFRNQYDTDVTTWSPAGRLFQVEYAMEAVKQGSAAIGLRSKTHVVLACVNKANSELSSHQKKIFKVDNHIGVAIAGLTADGRVLSRYMRSECINYNYTYESPLPVGRLVVQLADKAQILTVFEICVVEALDSISVGNLSSTQYHGGVSASSHNRPSLPTPSPSSSSLSSGYSRFNTQSSAPTGCESNPHNVVPEHTEVCTQRSWKRPYGVGLLVAGLDESGAHLYYNCPSGNYFEYQAFAIGSRSQAAKTYLERRFDNFMGSSREDLIKDALIATRESLQGEKLRSSVCTIAVVGVGEPFHILDQETVQQLIDTFEIVKEDEPPAEEAQPATEQDAPTDQASGADQGAAGDQGGSPMEI